jgi:hypothetical protein
MTLYPHVEVYFGIKVSREKAGGIKMKYLNTAGQGLVEYLILLLLISIVSLVTVKAMGTIIKNKLELAKDNISREVTIGR